MLLLADGHIFVEVFDKNPTTTFQDGLLYFGQNGAEFKIGISHLDFWSADLMFARITRLDIP